MNNVHPEELSQNMLAQLVGKSTTTIDRWRKAGCPRKKDKTYSLPDVIAWQIAQATAKLEDELAGLQSENGSSADDQRYKAARADLKELERAERLGQLCNRDDVHQLWSTVLTTFAQLLQGLPHSLAARLEGKERQEREEVIEVALRHTLDSMKSAYELGQEE